MNPLPSRSTTLKRKLLYSILSASLFSACIPLAVSAQWSDAGLWTNVTLEKKITKDLDILVTEEFRFNEDMTHLGAFFTDAGAEYTVVKGFKTGLFYRFTNRSRDDGSWSQGHRIYADFSYRQKISRFTAGYRVRFQVQYKDINRSETGRIPTWYFRQKLHLAYNTKSRFDPYLDGEVWYQLNPEYFGFVNLRMSAGVVIRIIKSHSVDLGYIYQRELNTADPETDHILFIGYKFSF